MRSEIELFKAQEGERVEGLGKTPRSPKRAPASRGKRSSVISRILVDAQIHAREYVERWIAGRGAE